MAKLPAVSSMLEPEQGLRVVVQDLVRIGFRQAEALDIGEGFLVGFVILQYRVVAAGDEMVGAKGFEGTQKSRFRAVADGVVVEFPRGNAGRLGEVRMAPGVLPLFVETVEQHRDRPAEM